MLFILTSVLLLHLSSPRTTEAAGAQTPESVRAARDADIGRSQLIFRAANESNPGDGPFGPLTYGLRATRAFANQMELEAGYMRLHEPRAPMAESVIDEARLAFKLPPARVAAQPLVLGAAAWKNRMIDMYTDVGGLELARPGLIELLLGAYLGNATRGGVRERFVGGQLGAGGALGPVYVSASCMVGTIETGAYRRAAVEGSSDLFTRGKMPLTLTFAIEERYFRFGRAGPVSEPRDEFIFVTGLEFHFERLVLGALR